MATPHQASTLSGNGEAPAQPAKRKTSRKSASAAPVKRAASRRAAPLEILFTQEPDPHRQPAPPYIWIDHPGQAEALTAPHYVIRLGVGGEDSVEISIDKSAWLPCRHTSGYWWYDWSNISKGKHTLVARMRLPDGRWFKTPPRTCDSKF